MREIRILGFHHREGPRDTFAGATGAEKTVLLDISEKFKKTKIVKWSSNSGIRIVFTSVVVFFLRSTEI